jgi:hypothetical protein
VDLLVDVIGSSVGDLRGSVVFLRLISGLMCSDGSIRVFMCVFSSELAVFSTDEVEN